MPENRQGDFVQVLSLDLRPKFEKVPIYWTKCPAPEIQRLLVTLKAELPAEPFDVGHIQRIVKTEESTENGKPILKVMLCTQATATVGTLQELIGEYEINEGFIAKQQAESKETSHAWAEKTWPILWRGNPEAQLPTLSTDEQRYMNTHILRLQEALASARRAAQDNPQLNPKNWWKPRANEEQEVRSPVSECSGISCTLVVDPRSEVLRASVTSDPSRALRHSIMIAVEEVAENTRKQETRGKNTDEQASSESELVSKSTEEYLCTDHDIFTTAEPCAMCAMALIHSRARRLIFVDPSPSDGALSPDNALGYGLHGRKQLNHTFEVWRYLPLSA